MKQNVFYGREVVQPIAFMLARGDLKNSSRTLAAAPEMHGASRLARGPGGGGEQ